MGYMAHHGVIAIGSDKQFDQASGRYDLPSDWVLAVEEFRASMPEEFQKLLVGPVAGLVNGYAAVTFLPDGSKEGWDTSNEADEYRDAFCRLAVKHGADWVYVRFGGDDPDLANIIGASGRDSDDHRYDQATR